MSLFLQSLVYCVSIEILRMMTVDRLLESEIYKLELSAETAKKLAEILRDDVFMHSGFVSHQVNNNKA